MRATARQASAMAATSPAPAPLPRHVAITMDGNGRWARARGLPHAAGHRAGAETCFRVVDTCRRLGIPILTVYAFSTENWSRPPDHVSTLLRLLGDSLLHYCEALVTTGVRLRHLGRTDGLPADLIAALRAVAAATAHNHRLQLQIALNYGGRAEIVDAVHQLAASGADLTTVTEAHIGAHLYTAGLPDPDLIIRTSGEMRLSNFLLWQSAYAEYVFLEKCWPDFGEADLLQALAAYADRRRRYGGLTSIDDSRL